MAALTAGVAILIAIVLGAFLKKGRPLKPADEIHLIERYIALAKTKRGIHEFIAELEEILIRKKSAKVEIDSARMKPPSAAWQQYSTINGLEKKGWLDDKGHLVDLFSILSINDKVPSVWDDSLMSICKKACRTFLLLKHQDQDANAANQKRKEKYLKDYKTITTAISNADMGTVAFWKSYFETYQFYLKSR